MHNEVFFFRQNRGSIAPYNQEFERYRVFPPELRHWTRPTRDPAPQFQVRRSNWILVFHRAQSGSRRGTLGLDFLFPVRPASIFLKTILVRPGSLQSGLTVTICTHPVPSNSDFIDVNKHRAGSGYWAALWAWSPQLPPAPVPALLDLFCIPRVCWYPDPRLLLRCWLPPEFSEQARQALQTSQGGLVSVLGGVVVKSYTTPRP